jgi:site-specific DNA-methyltransferase (adenine-specific)
MINLHNIDCMEYMKGLDDNAFELAIVDPPYRENNQPDQWMRAKDGDMKKWDSPPSKEYFDELRRVSENQIIWGGNYFTENLEPNNNWVIWQKVNEGVHFSMCEMAWSSLRKNIKLVKMLSSDWANNGGGKTFHPTQKPVKLYEWLLSNYAKEGDKILDTHLGSGSSAIAAHYGGFDFVGCELDEDYYKAATERFNNETKQQDMF